MCNICTNDIAKMFLVLFSKLKIVDLIEGFFFWGGGAFVKNLLRVESQELLGGF